MNKYISENQPTKEDLIHFMGNSGKYYTELEKLFLQLNPNIKVNLHNTGNGGWIIKYYIKKRYVAQFNIVEGSFELMCRFNDKASANVISVEDCLVGNGRTAWKRRYPCGTGFWIHLWINNECDYKDASLLAPILVKGK